MLRRSTVLRTVLVTALGITLTACGGDGSGQEGGETSSPATAGAATGESSGKSPAAAVEWSPALTLGQPAPKLYSPDVTGGGTFQVTAEKIVEGTREQMEEGHYDEGELAGGTPYFVYVTYTLKEGDVAVANADLNANAAVLDENGEPAAQRPEVHTGYVEGGCPVADIHSGWEVGEKRTVCSIFIADPSKKPARLAWSTDAETADDHKRGASWAWSTTR
ncbi:hypothetical protein ACIRFH_17290 [Streptomyces sp. NPDC093586]|uniref:hypothetical protein n=1 Tax=Streptomyces sp. NPDC093586 TaxID=3366042 RepID=UPI00381C20FE